MPLPPVGRHLHARRVLAELHRRADPDGVVAGVRLVQAIAAELQIDTRTVHRAYRRLADDDLIRRESTTDDAGGWTGSRVTVLDRSAGEQANREHPSVRMPEHARTS